MENYNESTPRNTIYPSNKINYLFKYIKASVGVELLKTGLLNSVPNQINMQGLNIALRIKHLVYHYRETTERLINYIINYQIMMDMLSNKQRRHLINKLSTK